MPSIRLVLPVFFVLATVSGCHSGGATTAVPILPGSESTSGLEKKSGTGTDKTAFGKAGSSETVSRERVAKAMRGLRYETGRVQIDRVVGRQIAPPGSREQGMILAQQGMRFLEENNFAQGLEAYTKAALTFTGEPSIYEGLGDALGACGKPTEAIAAYRTALDLDSLRIDTRYKLGLIQQKTELPADAVQTWREVINLRSDYADAHVRLAMALYSLDDFTDAWAHVHTAETLGQTVPSQFRESLTGRMSEPAQ